MTPAQKSFVLSMLINKVLQNPKIYGLSAEGIIKVGDKLDFTKLFENSREIESIFNKARETIIEGSPQEKSILENNKKISDWIQAHPNETLDESKVSEILNTKPDLKIAIETPTVSDSLIKIEPIKSPIPEVLEKGPELVEKVPEAFQTESLESPMSPLDKEFIEKRNLEQTREEIAEARRRLTALEHGEKAERNPNLERTLVSDAEALKEVQNHPFYGDFKRGIDKIYGKRGFFGGKVMEGIKTAEWQKINGFTAKELVQYTENEAERLKLSPNFLEVMKSSKNQRFAEELRVLLDRTEGVVKPREREMPGEFMLRLIKFNIEKSPQLASLRKAA